MLKWSLFLAFVKLYLPFHCHLSIVLWLFLPLKNWYPLKFCSFVYSLLMWYHKLNSVGCSQIYVSNLDLFWPPDPHCQLLFGYLYFDVLLASPFTEFKTQPTIFPGPLKVHLLLCYCLLSWSHHFPSFPIQVGAAFDSAFSVSSVCVFVYVPLILPPS